MDLYTTSFTLPRQSSDVLRTISPLSGTLPLPGSTGPSAIPLPDIPSTTALTAQAATPNLTTSNQTDKDWEAVQKLAIDITTREGCLVTVTKELLGVETGSVPPPSLGDGLDGILTSTIVWNFHFSGTYQAVMAARGAVLREYPRDNRFTLKFPRTEILESPLATISPVKPDIKRRFDDIAAESQADIAVVNMETPGSSGMGGRVLATSKGSKVSQAEKANGHSKSSSDASARGTSGRSSNNGSHGQHDPPTKSAAAEQVDGANSKPSAAITYGLETERMCELVITGRLENVEIAKVRLLVLLDELNGLHSEVCDIDYKLHAIIAGRKRSVIQSIQEETATNIYYPTPLVGIFNRPQPGSNQGLGYRSMNMHSSGGISMQNTGMTGMTPQMTGHSPAGVGMSHGLGNGHQHGSTWNMGPQMTGSVGHMNGYAPHGQQHSGPIYNPHQHVQYPYQPQPLDFNPQTVRGMPYSGPAMNHYNNINGMASPMHMQHTGMSNMTGYESSRGMASPAQMGMGEMHMGQQQQHHQQNHQMNGNYTHGHANQHHHNMNRFSNGQNHMHVSLGGGSMGMSGNTNIGMSGNGMGMGMGVSMGMPGHYGQGPHPGLSIHCGEQGVMGKANQIWITGEFFGVQRARDMLLNVAMQKSRLVISRDTAILPRKLDWLLTERLEEVKAIMSDNGTYMQVPSVGSQASLITVFGDHRVNIERTIRSIMTLACQFYVASFWLLPVAFDVLMPQASLNPAHMQPVLKRIAHATGAEVVFKSNCFEMHGLEAEVRAAVVMVTELDLIHNFHHEIRFQIELANEFRDFIAGKKNGKTNKVMRQAGVKIKFETFNDYNFLMDISGSDMGALAGLSMLQEELPAEISFHIPESYHKRIIGVSGRNIQRIMKTFGVYVKFSNAEEYAQLGGYTDNDDNVVARTPAKNAINLESMRQAVMELVNPKDRDYTSESVSIPRRYHRTLLGEKSIFIHDIENKTNSLVRFPYKESASDIVIIFGPESQIHIAAAMLLDHVPFEADLHVPPNPELTLLVSSTNFILFTEHVKRDHQIAISPSAKFGQGDEAVFKFRCQRSNVDFLSTARDALEEFLAQHNIQVYPAHAEKRVDSFADAFTHFNSKLLSNRAQAAARHTAAPEIGDNGLTHTLPARPITTDVKALFDGPSAPGSNEGFQSMTDPASRGFAGPLSYHDPRRVSEYWQPPHASNQPIEQSHSKRDSDPIIQDKLRQATLGPGVPLTHPTGPSHSHSQSQSHSHPRGIATRTQSLDITSINFSRTLSSNAGGFGPMPASPSPAIMASSANTASGQYFPAAQANGTGKGSVSYGYDAGIEGVTGAMNTVHI